MASACISECVNDAHLPVRATFVNLYRWPESDVEFVKTTVSSNMRGGGPAPAHAVPSSVYSLSSRQMYLRSYKFSRKKVGVTKKTIKCLSRLWGRVVCYNNNVFGKAKDVSNAALVSVVHRLQSCSPMVDFARSYHNF